MHTGATAEKHIADGVLEEALAHEAAHTSLNAALAESADWLAAQAADDAFISDDARDNPLREDVAETVVPWIAVCCGEPRVDDKPPRRSSGARRTGARSSSASSANGPGSRRTAARRAAWTTGKPAPEAGTKTPVRVSFPRNPRKLYSDPPGYRPRLPCLWLRQLRREATAIACG